MTEQEAWVDAEQVAAQSLAARELKEVAQQIKETLGRDALDADDNLAETYHETRRVYGDDGRRYLVYRGRIDHRQIVIVWRETEGWQKADLERDKKFVAERKLTEGADDVFVNGDFFIPNARALEPVFKARMFAEVQA